MTKAEKSTLIEELTREFGECSAVIACGYETMTVQELESFRHAAREAEVNVKVVKNRIANIALEANEKGGMVLKNMNLFVWGEDIASTAKLVTNFAKDNEKLVIKTGFIDGSIVDEKGIEAFSKLPSREDLLGMLLSTWTAPLRNLLYVWTAAGREFVTVLDAIKNSKDN